MKALGLMFTGLIQQYYGITLPHPLPGHMAALIMATVKISRAARPVFHADNYDDGHAFLRFAQDGHAGGLQSDVDEAVEALKKYGWKEQPK